MSIHSDLSTCSGNFKPSNTRNRTLNRSNHHRCSHDAPCDFINSKRTVRARVRTSNLQRLKISITPGFEVIQKIMVPWNFRGKDTTLRYIFLPDDSGKLKHEWKPSSKPNSIFYWNKCNIIPTKTVDHFDFVKGSILPQSFECILISFNMIGNNSNESDSFHTGIRKLRITSKFGKTLDTVLQVW